MTPFEQQEPSSPKIKRPKLEERQYFGNPSVSSSTDLSASEKDRNRCGPISEQSGLNTQTNDRCTCVEIAREREGPSAQTPSSVDIFNPRNHALQNHRHRRHSLFYEPISLSADKGLGPLGQLFNPLGQESIPIEAESNPLEEEYNTLEAASKLLEHEAIRLEEAHGYEDPDSPGAEEGLSRHTVNLDDWYEFCRVQKARSSLRLKNEKSLSISKSQIQDNEVRRGRSPEKQHVL
jgi:hypothetical protein